MSIPLVTSCSIYDIPITSATKYNYKLEVEEYYLDKEIFFTYY
jgi:hypothetical protein